MNARQAFRLGEGGRIDRHRTLGFTFDGRRYEGHPGDTLASALLANGVRVVGRSSKFHRPRGVLSCGAEEPNALVCVGQGGLEEPNVRATQQPLYEGLVARSQNCWPNVNFDLWRWIDVLHGLFPAGFYNKTFIWPSWRWYEGLIRRAAGLGDLPPAPDPENYAQRNAHYDVLVCGAGPAGLSAALAAAETGQRVMLVEQDTELGGSLLWNTAQIAGRSPDEWLAEVKSRLAAYDNLIVLTNACVSAYFDHDLALIEERVSDGRAAETRAPRERLWKVHAREFVFATGAIEQPLVFPYNDRPGIMLSGAVRQYLERFAVVSGKRVVLATNNDSAYCTALALLDAGISVECVVDTRAGIRSAVSEQVRARGIAVLDGCIPAKTSGAKGISAIEIRRVDSRQNQERGPVASLNCDCLAMSGGWQPAVHLLSQARGRLRYDGQLGAFLPQELPKNIRVVGAAAGEVPPCLRATVTASPGRQWIDFQHDVTLQDIGIAVDEGFGSIEHLKRYTTTGMSVDQGKTSNLNALAALAERSGRPPEQIGTTTFRPFYMPVTLAALAGSQSGEFYAPSQRSPIYGCHEQLNAEIRDYGSWRRPAAYPRQGESTAEAIRREALAARNAVALFDGSPLGKIEVRGRDAAEFLNRVYVNQVPTLKSGQARYGIMLNENGVVIDDGIFAKLEEGHFLVHTTSGAAARIYAWLEEWSQSEWPQLDLLLTPVTSQWANIAVSGPAARALLQRLPADIDWSAEKFPHMHIRSGSICAVPARVMRASFTGEVSFEVNVPADFGASLWERLLELGADLGVTPIGVETLMLLRTEKGYMHVGTDTDGNTCALDVGWAAAVEKKSADFIGKRSLMRPNNVRERRFQLVGLLPQERGREVVAGAHVLNEEHRSAPAPTQGYVTSACFSPTLDRWVALGLVCNGRKRMGERVNLFHAGAIQPAIVTAVGAYDPESRRLHA